VFRGIIFFSENDNPSSTTVYIPGRDLGLFTYTSKIMALHVILLCLPYLFGKSLASFPEVRLLNTFTYNSKIMALHVLLCLAYLFSKSLASFPEVRLRNTLKLHQQEKS
jgi:hypothetical protein